MDLRKKTKTLERSIVLVVSLNMTLTNVQAENEALWRNIVEDCDGAYGTLEQAISEMEIPRVKQVRSSATFKGLLQLGNPEDYNTAISIPVERYYRTYIAKPPTASPFALRSDVSGSQEDPEVTQSSATVGAEGSQPGKGSGLTTVRNLRSYQVKDESSPGGKIDVERQDCAKGYEYGRTAVHISETDENITILDTSAAMELVGFIQSDKVRLFLSNFCQVWTCTNLISTTATCTCLLPI